MPCLFALHLITSCLSQSMIGRMCTQGVLLQETQKVRMAAYHLTGWLHLSRPDAPSFHTKKCAFCQEEEPDWMWCSKRQLGQVHGPWSCRQSTAPVC